MSGALALAPTTILTVARDPESVRIGGPRVGACAATRGGAAACPVDRRRWLLSLRPPTDNRWVASGHLPPADRPGWAAGADWRPI